MICDNCGNEVADGMKFCGYCGNQVKQRNVCPSCGREIEARMAYCGFCGTKVGTVKADNVLPKETAAAPQDTRQQITFSATKEVFEIGTPQNTYGQTAPMYQSVGALKTIDVAWFKGEVKAGFTEASGKLSIYRNRIELKKTMGGSKSYAFFGIVGMAVSAAKVKNDAPVIFPMNQIAWVRESKYFGVRKSMIIEMKNGEKHTFIGTAKEIQECIDLIRANIR